MSAPPPGGVQWGNRPAGVSAADWANYQKWVEGYAGIYGVPPQVIVNMMQLESDFRPAHTQNQSSATGILQFLGNSTSWWANQGQRFDRTNPEASIANAARYLDHIYRQFYGEEGTTGRFNEATMERQWGPVIAGYRGGQNDPRVRYYAQTGDPGRLPGAWNWYTQHALQGVPTPYSGGGIGSDANIPINIPSAEALRTQPGILSALEGSAWQSLGFMPGWGYDYGSHTWQNTGGVGGWSLMDTSNPDVIESGLFQQWLPQGFQAAGPEVWEQTPLQFWAPDWSTDLLPSGASLQSGQAPFDLFNPQGQFDVNMLNAPGAVSPELGGWLQQQGIVNPSKGYNPVDQVWQDAPPAPGWQLINTTNVDPVYQQQITQQMSSLFPMGHFDNIFEGTGANPWSGPPVQNWLPPPAPGSSYHFGMVPGTSSSSTIAPGSGFGVIEGAEGLGYQGSAGITTIDPGILGLGADINANAQQMIAQGHAQAAAFNAQQQFHNQQMLNQVSNPWGGGWQPGFGLLY